MSNPFVPGKEKVSPIGKTMSEEIVKKVAQELGMQANPGGLHTENVILLGKATIAYENKDFVGYISYILRGVFLSVLADDYSEGLTFAREFLRTQNQSTKKITEVEISQIAALYAAALGSADTDKIKTEHDAETVIRLEFIDKAHVHAAAKLVSRFARFSAYAEGSWGKLDVLRSFCELLHASVNSESVTNAADPKIKNTLASSMSESNRRYANATKENDPGVYSAYVMQTIYDYCVFVNIGIYDVKALTNLLAKIEAFALYNNTERIGDIARMIREDFTPNQQYGE